MTKPTEVLTLKPRHKWFAVPADHETFAEVWHGPSDTIQGACLAVCESYENEQLSAFTISQGRKTTKSEQEEGFTEWQVEGPQLKIEIKDRP